MTSPIEEALAQALNCNCWRRDGAHNFACPKYLVPRLRAAILELLEPLRGLNCETDGPVACCDSCLHKALDALIAEVNRG